MGQSKTQTGKEKKPSRAASQRVSYAHFPAAVETVEFPYASKRPLHAARDAGEKAHSIRTGDLWQSIVAETCAEWDRERDCRPDGKRKPGPRRKYTCEEGETIELLRRLLGVTSYTAVIDWLSSDRGRIACGLLGFDRERQAPRRGDPRRFRQAGIPSASTLSDLRNDIGEDRRLALWQRFETALRERYAAQTERESRVLHLDGVNIRTKGEAPKYHAKTGKLVNPETASVFDGGYQPMYANGKKGGHGFNMVLLTDDLGVPLAYEIGPMQASESVTAVRVLDAFNEGVRPHLPTDEVRVVSADAAFSAPTVRMAARRAGMIENIHNISHHKKRDNFKTASNANNTFWEIQGYDRWQANRHRELVCTCGEGTSERIAWIDRHGNARTRSKGRCKTCGSITLLSGDWRAARNPARWVRTLPGESPERADWQFGNPLTYNDRMAARYGRKRWVRGEGVHGILATHYKLNADRRQYRRKRQVELEASIVFSCILSLALQQREHERVQAASSQPTGITPAALAVAA